MLTSPPTIPHPEYASIAHGEYDASSHAKRGSGICQAGVASVPLLARRRHRQSRRDAGVRLIPRGTTIDAQEAELPALRGVLDARATGADRYGRTAPLRGLLLT
jgi:hypothetical protein